MSGLHELVQIKTTYTRSINLERDGGVYERVASYLPTSRALTALAQITEGLHAGSGNRALALIGPYGAGKSAFALFLGAVLSNNPVDVHLAALDILQSTAPDLADRISQALYNGKGYLRVQINGLPDSLVRQVLRALAISVEKAGLSNKLAQKIHRHAVPGKPIDQVLSLFREVQNTWAEYGGSGVLVEIDELGKFLEYESHHPQFSEIHLLQLLAEHAQSAHRAPLHLVVMLHQAFEHYSHRLGKSLREEWQKVQGRFTALAFLEPAEQSLRIVGAAFQRQDRLPPEIDARLDTLTRKLADEDALPAGLEEEQARQVFGRCYPLHPLSLLILPVLCQKVAQNERTLFSYLGSNEPHGFCDRLGRLHMGEWIEPCELYDYFMLNPTGGFTDPLTYHRWIEVATALERLDSHPDHHGAALLKTIGLLNLIGAQRGLKASQPLLETVFGAATEDTLAQLQSASIIHYRQFSQEYRVWQGSDFDLAAALRQAAAEYAVLPLDNLLNSLAQLKPIVARRATIATGSLRGYVPMFASRGNWPAPAKTALNLWFYLAESDEQPDTTSFPPGAVVAVCDATEGLRTAMAEWIALLELPKMHAVLHQDPVAQREHRAWLINAEAEALQLIHALLGEPESPSLRWFWAGSPQPVTSRRDLQRQLSAWIEERIYPHSPLFRNELINRDQPSSSANTARKRLLTAMLSNPAAAYLGIEKTPAEMSLYLSLLKDSGIHRVYQGQLGFYPPDADHDPCRVGPAWAAITRQLGDSGARQMPIPELYRVLTERPYGIKEGVLPILLVAYLLAHRREVAVYQEGTFCENLTIEQAELLCRRPELFAIERFDLGGLRGELFNQYMSSVIGQMREDASLLDIVRPLVKFMSGLPEYTRHCASLSLSARKVQTAFNQAQSPGLLLFEALPRACGINPADFSTGETSVVESFIQCLIGSLRELKSAYPQLLEHWRQTLQKYLLDNDIENVSALRAAVTARYDGLDQYTPDRMGLGALVKRLTDTAHTQDTAWLESVATLLGRMPPSKWREETRVQAELRLREMAQQLRELERLRYAIAERGTTNALLFRVVDLEGGEHSRVLHLNAEQQAKAANKADALADQFEDLDESERFAVIAALFKRFNPGTGERPHE